MNVLTIKQEAEDITAKNGYYIPPYRFKLMAKAAEKISSTLVGAGNELTYTEMIIVLKSVENSLIATTNVRKEGV